MYAQNKNFHFSSYTYQIPPTSMPTNFINSKNSINHGSCLFSPPPQKMCISGELVQWPQIVSDSFGNDEAIMAVTHA